MGYLNFIYIVLFFICSIFQVSTKPEEYIPLVFIIILDIKIMYSGSYTKYIIIIIIIIIRSSSSSRNNNINLIY